MNHNFGVENNANLLCREWKRLEKGHKFFALQYYIAAYCNIISTDTSQ